MPAHLLAFFLGLYLSSGNKFPECDSTAIRQPSDDGIIETDPVLESDTLPEPAKILVEEKERVGDIAKIHFYIGRRGRKIKHGAYEVFYKDAVSGKRIESGKFVQDKAEGTWTNWDSSGRVTAEKEYHRGRMNGYSILYRPNGMVAEKTKLKDGKIDCKDGFSEGFYENGKPKFEFRLKDGYVIKDVRYDSLGRQIFPSH